MKKIVRIGKKHPFSLMEVLISLMILGVAAVPLLQGISGRAEAYKNMRERIVADMKSEEIFFSELALIATGEEISYASLLDGYRKETAIGQKTRIITTFEIVDPLENEESSSGPKEFLGKLSTRIRFADDASRQNPQENQEKNQEKNSERSVLLVFQEKS